MSSTGEGQLNFEKSFDDSRWTLKNLKYTICLEFKILYSMKHETGYICNCIFKEIRIHNFIHMNGKWIFCWDGDDGASDRFLGFPGLGSGCPLMAERLSFL